MVRTRMLEKVTVVCLIFLLFIFGVEAFLDSNAGTIFAYQNHSLLWLFVGIYAASYYLGVFALYLESYLASFSEAIFLGRRLLSLWLSCALLFCLVLSLDFSSQGLSRSLIFFLLPGEIAVVLLPAIAEAGSFFVFGSVLASLLVIAIVKVWLMCVKIGK